MDGLIARAREGFEALDVPAALVESAVGHLETWVSMPALSAYLPQIEALVAAGEFDKLLDAFYRVIPFGTGGRRGAVGIGPNRINPWTLGTSVQGHAQYLKQTCGEGAGVVIAYDVRCFKDVRGVYRAGIPNPVLGLSSRDFAEQAAGVYAANGLRVHILPRNSGTWLSTPELSFAIRFYGAQGGLNVSASHNPPDDNGAKIYDSTGGQAIPPHDEALAREVARVTELRTLSWDRAREEGWILPIEKDLHLAYLEHNLALSRWPESRNVAVVFTPLHGTGCTTVVDLLAIAGFQVRVEPAQGVADGAFSAVPFANPNPEVHQSMDRAIALADECGADLVMACDPDADRLGMCVWHKESWRALTGNEIGALLVDTVLMDRERPALVVKTEVTSSLISRIAVAHGAALVDDLLVGFKYIGAGLASLENNGEFAGVKASVQDFAVGVEESHGYLVTPGIRDKDAAGAALLLAERASLERGQDRTLVDVLEDLWVAHGFVSNQLISTVMRGAVGRTKIEAIQESLRKDPPATLGGQVVVECLDHLNPEGRFGPILSETDASSRDVLVFLLEGGGRLILRPSGTEPKTKVYAELGSAPGSAEAPAQLDLRCKALAEALVMEMLARVGIRLPGWALAVSDLVPIEQKQHFAEELMPQLVARLQQGEPVRDWLDQELEPLGRDPRALIAPGVAAWIQAHSPVPALVTALEEALKEPATG
jgi:phosphoglucomutase/phosphomannomutase